ncbi:MAG: dihydropteroate synthase [Bacteroidetes bacterium 4484_249]|nr:MAG: dihydropteroate synthase [Bacteroidetes bacterium 4484_249]
MKKSPDKSTSFSNGQELNCNEKTLSLAKPVIMGILNITPDSFYDGGKFRFEKEQLNKVEKMVIEGAAIIDVGAVSTRPGAKQVSQQEELNRLLPVVKIILNSFPEVFISVDTFRSEVAKAVINEGIHIINDISGGTFDEKMFEVIAGYKVPYIMMHIKGTPENMQESPQYENVVEEIKEFFKVQLEKLAKLNITENIVLDPGFGFGKTLEHNFEILKNLNLFKNLGFPLLAGLSRKSMINKVLNIKPAQALNGTTVLNTIALLNGANILRVHDVKEAVEAVKLVETLLALK